jgi:hypothetical protein
MKNSIIVIALVIISILTSYETSRFVITKLYEKSVMEAKQDVKEYLHEPYQYCVNKRLEDNMGFTLIIVDLVCFLIWFGLIMLVRHIFRKVICEKGDSNGYDEIPYTTPLLAGYGLSLLFVFILPILDMHYISFFIK